MLAIKAYYTNGHIELLEPMPDHIHSAELNIIVIPSALQSEVVISADTYQVTKKTSEDDFKLLGITEFFNTEDDSDIDWEECFGLK